VTTPARAPRAAAAVLALLLAGALAGQALLQRGFERRFPRQAAERLLYLPSGQHLEILSLGFHALAADVLWMKAIGYFGSHALTDERYPWLAHILDLVTTLDPQFRYPYYFGGIVLSVAAEHAEESNRLLRKAMARFPADWRFPFFAGFNHFYYLGEPERAAALINYAATLPGAPEYLPRLGASLLAESGRLESAIRFLETMAENTRDEAAREGILRKVADLRAGRVPEKVREFLSGRRAP
jgi:hypothetical protein